MSDQMEYDLVRREMGQQLPIGEPSLSMKDENILDAIEILCKEYLRDAEGKLMINPETNEPVEIFKYRDIYVHAYITLSHLGGITNWTDETARSAYCKYVKRHLIITSVHKRDYNARIALDEIDGTVYRMIYGDSLQGTKQDFLAKMAGSIKSLELMQGIKKERPWWR